MVGSYYSVATPKLEPGKYHPLALLIMVACQQPKQCSGVCASGGGDTGGAGDGGILAPLDRDHMTCSLLVIMMLVVLNVLQNCRIVGSKKKQSVTLKKISGACTVCQASPSLSCLWETSTCIAYVHCCRIPTSEACAKVQRSHCNTCPGSHLQVV